MSNGNIIVTSTVNKVTWVVDESSYKRALKRIKSLKSAHEKPAKDAGGCTETRLAE